jgi:hypothetical protein
MPNAPCPPADTPLPRCAADVAGNSGPFRCAATIREFCPGTASDLTSKASARVRRLDRRGELSADEDGAGVRLDQSERPEVLRFPDAGRGKHFHTDGGRRLETSKGRNRGKGDVCARTLLWRFGRGRATAEVSSATPLWCAAVKARVIRFGLALCPSRAGMPAPRPNPWVGWAADSAPPSWSTPGKFAVTVPG